MLEDLKEIRNLLDKFIAKYETDAKNLFGEDYFKSPTEDLNKKPDKPLAGGMEGCTIGNDYY
tara:strand:- start:391 stop:576 length:186 start_codon:yes stop_codon:yes gene_type:complete